VLAKVFAFAAHNSLFEAVVYRRSFVVGNASIPPIGLRHGCRADRRVAASEARGGAGGCPALTARRAPLTPHCCEKTMSPSSNAISP
jgi:hypothetical protein